MTKYKFRATTANIKSNPLMIQKKVASDVRAVARIGGIIGWQEINPDRYFEAINSLGAEWEHFMPEDGNGRIPIPISWKAKVWEKVDEGFVKTHGGRALVTPSRYISWVVLRHRAGGFTVARVNTHAISGGWSKGWRPTTKWRRKMWYIHMAKLDEIITLLSRKHLVVVGGDFNRDKFRLLGKRVAYDNDLNVGTHGGVHGRTYDYLAHTRSDRIRRRWHKVYRDLFTDHDVVSVGYEVEL